jgi:purine-nucleoside phosphorylase
MIMNPAYEKLLKCYDSYKAKIDYNFLIDFTPKVALILGSGLGDYADDIRVVDTLDYHDIEGFPVSTVPGHKGRFIFGYVDDVPVVCMQGRVHYYEGYEMSDVVLPTRLMKMMGAEVLFLTNAAGGMQLGMHAGDFMLIKDQIASFVPSPLRGANIEELGVRFPDMSQIYDLDLQDIVKRAASALEIRIKEGTYIQLSGPQFETPHEVAMCRTLGADAVGMSTACEAIAAKHMGMKVLGISCISNLASGISSIPLSHAEVQETADAVAPKFKALVTETIKAIGAQQN